VGQLWDADHVVFERVTGTVGPRAEGLAGASGDFEVHEGGIVGGDARLQTGREYRLVFEDGGSWPIRLTKVGATNSAGIARIEFEIRDDPTAEAHFDSAEA